MAHWMHEASEYAAAHGIPTIHEDTSGQGEGDIEVRRLRLDLSLLRSNLERFAGPHPDGTCMDDPNSFERRFANFHGCGHPKDSGYVMSRLEFLARSVGLGHPEVAAALGCLGGWLERLPHDFEAVRAEYLAWHAGQVCGDRKMFRQWREESLPATGMESR